MPSTEGDVTSLIIKKAIIRPLPLRNLDKLGILFKNTGIKGKI
jgi:hypothetical protein